MVTKEMSTKSLRQSGKIICNDQNGAKNGKYHIPCVVIFCDRTPGYIVNARKIWGGAWDGYYNFLVKNECGEVIEDGEISEVCIKLNKAGIEEVDNIIFEKNGGKKLD